MNFFLPHWLFLWCSFRCNNATQILEYESYIRKLDYANDNAIFTLTGCLSNCNKYKYKVRALGPVQKSNDDSGEIPANTIELGFYYPTTEHEVREQVPKFEENISLRISEENLKILVLYLYLGVNDSRCWRLPGPTHWPKHLWNLWHINQLVHPKEIVDSLRGNYFVRMTFKILTPCNK